MSKTHNQCKALSSRTNSEQETRECAVNKPAWVDQHPPLVFIRFVLFVLDTKAVRPPNIPVLWELSKPHQAPKNGIWSTFVPRKPYSKAIISAFATNPIQTSCVNELKTDRNHVSRFVALVIYEIPIDFILYEINVKVSYSFPS